MSFSPHLRLAVAVGFVGAYTTFSTFEYETIRLLEEGHGVSALLNVILSVVVGFAAVWGGTALARKIERVPVTSHALYDRFEELADLSDPHQSMLRGARHTRFNDTATRNKEKGLMRTGEVIRGTGPETTIEYPATCRARGERAMH